MSDEDNGDGTEKIDEESQLEQLEDARSHSSEGSKSRTSSDHDFNKDGRDDKELSLAEKYFRRAQAVTVLGILKDEDAIKFDTSESEFEETESDIWTEYGNEVSAEKTDSKNYTKWKPPKNKLTQDIRRRKSIKKKQDTDTRDNRYDTALASVMAGAGSGKSNSQIFFYDWSENYRKVLKELKADQLKIKHLDGTDSESEGSSFRTSSLMSAMPSLPGGRTKTPGSSRSGSRSSGSQSRGSTPPEKTNTGGFSFKSVLQGGTGKDGGGGGGGLGFGGRRFGRKLIKDIMDPKWPKHMWDNMSGYWRMQCAEETFWITPNNYSLYLDPVERERELKVSWDTYIKAKEKCMKWLGDYSQFFAQ